jgi:hypothetical protein
MKKISIISIIILLGPVVCSQEYLGRSIRLGSSSYVDKYYLVGSLKKTNSSVFQKLKVSIIGGNWHNSTTGENEYFISTRDGIKINQEVHGGAYSKYTLLIFENGAQYDFVITPTAGYPFFNIRSWKIEDAGYRPIEIKDYDITGKIDITNSVEINKIFVTNYGGNIGIGKSPSNQAKLDVAGTIRATEIKVEAQTADFVFEDNYPLRTLDEVEAFIKTRGHLPSIPSAASMEKNGVNLAEINKLLLQKIEELTLYAIERDKEVRRLKEDRSRETEVREKLEEKMELLKTEESRQKKEIKKLKEIDRNTIDRLAKIETFLIKMKQ